MCTINDIEKMIARMDAALPAWSPDQNTVGIYFEELHDLPLYLLRAAVDMCIKELYRNWVPSPEEIRNMALGLIG